MTAFRIAGKRQIGQLHSSELVVAILIGEIAAVPIQDSGSSLFVSLIAIIILLLCEMLFSIICMNNIKIRSFFYGTPSVLIYNGIIDQKELIKQRFNINDIMEDLRSKGISSIKEVEYLIAEPNGTLSVIQCAKSRPSTNEDNNITPPKVKMSYIIIENGRINSRNLSALKLDNEWLFRTLKAHKYKSPKEIFFMSAEDKETFVIMPKT